MGICALREPMPERAGLSEHELELLTMDHYDIPYPNKHPNKDLAERNEKNMPPTIAWLAQGKVRVKKPGEPPRTIESQFGQTIREKAVRAEQRHSWKTGGQGDKFLSGAMLWGRVSKDPAAIRVAITSLCRGS